MKYVIKYLRGDSGNSRYFYAADRKYLVLMEHIMEPDCHNRIPESDIERVKCLAQAHGWSMIEVTKIGERIEREQK
jgi:hypothetical protein